MPQLAAADWIFLATTWALLAFAALLALYALFSDRPRGRRRCPKCWYDMAGVRGLVCPECGRDAGHQRRLLRTRRRWRLAAPAAIIAFTGFVLPDLVKEGWTGLIPTPALMAGVLWLPGPKGEAPWEWGWFGPRDIDQEQARIYSRMCKVLGARTDRRPQDSPTRRAVLRIADRRIDRELGRSPPRLPGVLCSLSETAAGQGRSRGDGPPHLATIWLETPAQSPAGSPLYAIVRTAGLGDEIVIAEFQAAWSGAPVHRTQMWTPYTRFKSDFLGWPTPQYAPWVDLGNPPSTAKFVTVNVTTRRAKHPVPDDKVHELPIVATRRLRLPVQIVPEGECHLTPAPRDTWPMTGWDDDAERLRGVLLHAARSKDSCWHVSLWGWGPLEPDVTYGARLTVLRDGEQMFTGEICIWKDMGFLSASSDSCSSERHAGASLLPIGNLNISDKGGLWTIRITGDRDIARRNPFAAKFWEGEVELPITHVDW